MSDLDFLSDTILNVFRVRPGDPVISTIALICIQPNLGHIVRALRMKGWICSWQRKDCVEEHLKAGIYVAPRENIESDITKIKSILKDAQIEEANIVKVNVNVNSYVVRDLLRETILLKLRGCDDKILVWKNGAAIVFVVKDENEKVDIGSKLFEAFKSFVLRVERIFNQLFVVMDYKLKIFPPDILSLITKLQEKDALEALYGILIRCSLEEDGKTHAKTILRGRVKSLHVREGKHYLTIYGEVVRKKNSITQEIVELNAEKMIEAKKCGLFGNVSYYKNLLKMMSEDYDTIWNNIKRQTSLVPEERLKHIKHGISLLRNYTFPLMIGDVSFILDEEPWHIEGYLE